MVGIGEAGLMGHIGEGEPCFVEELCGVSDTCPPDHFHGCQPQVVIRQFDQVASAPLRLVTIPNPEDPLNRSLRW